MAADILRNNTYVDDVMAGGDSIPDAQTKVSQINQLLLAGGFQLQKWVSNADQLLSNIDKSRQVVLPKSFEDDAMVRALGLTWNSIQDTFVIKFDKEVINTAQPTKRSVLSLISTMFGPLGWLSPIIVTAKIFLQRLWRLDLLWDEPLPGDSSRDWNEFLRELAMPPSFQLSRWVGTHSSAIMELHGFSDASQVALAAVVYIRVISEDFSGKSSLVIAKTKVAPVKRVTIARLELSAAVLLAQLINQVQASLEMKTVPVHLWTDSSVTLTWVKGQPAQWKEFVGNRVALIQGTVPGARWHHIAGVENPADCASRGLSPLQLGDQSLVARSRMAKISLRFMAGLVAYPFGEC